VRFCDARRRKVCCEQSNKVLPVDRMRNEERVMVVHHATPQLIHQLEQFYAFEHPAEVRTFLETQPDLVPVLSAASEPIKQLFGASVHCTMELERDPEDDEPLPHLYVVIRSSHGYDDVIHALDTFDSSWWSENASFTGDRLTFTVRLA
jgi:hypothetical protein